MGVPTLGYASRTDAVMALRELGLDNREIARRIGIEPSVVSALVLSRMRTRKGGGEAGASTARQHTVCIDNDTLRELRPHAAKRGMTVNALVRRMVALIADEGLTDAILDDNGARS